MTLNQNQLNKLAHDTVELVLHKLASNVPGQKKTNMLGGGSKPVSVGAQKGGKNETVRGV
jgi:hypothetical protein